MPEATHSNNDDKPASRSIRLKTLLFLNLLIIFIVVGLIIYALLKYQTFSSLTQTERNSLTDKNTQIIHTIDNEINQLGSFARDWAAWDDSYRFMQDHNTAYIDSNMGGDVTEVLGTVGLLYLDLDINEFYSFTDPGQQQRFDSIITQVKSEKELILNAVKNGTHRILLYNQELDAHFWYVIEEIVPTDNDQPANGYLVLCKEIDENFYEKVSHLSNSKIILAGDVENKNFDCSVPIVIGNFCQRVDLIDASKALLNIKITDNLGKKPIFLQAETNRLLNVQIKKAFKNTLTIILVSRLIIILLNLITVHLLIIKPASYLANKFAFFAQTRELAERLKLSGPYEIRELTSSANMMLDELEDMHQQLKLMSHTDELTQVYNRRCFHELFIAERASAIREKKHLTILLLDIDYFKSYNDNYGHIAGDRCLAKIADVLKQTLKRTNDIVARFGGEEFIILLKNTPNDGARVVCDRIAEAMKREAIPHEFSPAANYVTCSIGGVSVIPKETTKEQNMILVADEMLYKAKEQGRNQDYPDRPPLKHGPTDPPGRIIQPVTATTSAKVVSPRSILRIADSRSVLIPSSLAIATN